MNLLVPLRNAPRPGVLGLVDDVVEIVTDRVHQNLAVQVEGDIVGLTASTDLSDDWKSEAIMPRLVRVVQIGEIVLQVYVSSRHGVKVLNLLLHVRFSFRAGLHTLV